MPPRKKSATPKPEPINVTVARVTVLVAFNGMYAGDSAVLPVSDKMQAWVDMGLVRVDGADQTGPGEPVADNPGSVATRVGDSSASGDEPSEGFGAGGYGAFEG